MNQTSTLTGQCVAEFLGTGLLIFFGAGCVAALRVAGASFGQWEISIIWGLGVAMAIYLTAGVSGAHLNPAVTIALWLFACFERRKVLPFIVAQTAGAFCAAALVYGLYRQLFLDLEQSQHIVRGTAASLNLAGVFSTYPHPHITFIQAFAVETVSYTHLRAHETRHDLVCRLLLEKKKLINISEPTRLRRISNAVLIFHNKIKKAFIHKSR